MSSPGRNVTRTRNSAHPSPDETPYRLLPAVRAYEIFRAGVQLLTLRPARYAQPINVTLTGSISRWKSEFLRQSRLRSGPLVATEQDSTWSAATASGTWKLGPEICHWLPSGRKISPGDATRDPQPAQRLNSQSIDYGRLAMAINWQHPTASQPQLEQKLIAYA